MKLSRLAPALAGALFALTPSIANAQLTGFQEYYIPGKEDQLREIFRSFSISVGNDMHAVISATAASDTVIYYDHWEDGYDFNPLNPEATYDEKILVPAGTSHVFESSTIPANPRNPANTFYDGGDRLFSAGRTVAVMRASWPEVPGPNLAVSWEVYPNLAADTTYVVPVGEDFFPPPKKYDDFAQVHVLVMALEDNTTISIDDKNIGAAGSNECTVVLPTKGSTNKDTACEMRTTGRAKVTANKRVSVQMLGGINQGGEDRMRSLNIPPTALYGTEFFSPVPSFTGINTDLFLYNPSTTSAINVTVADAGGTNVISIPADSARSFETVTGRFLARNSAARITSPSNFYGFGAVSLGNSSYDWCFNLVRSNLLPELQAIPWGPGATDGADADTQPDGNGSPMFITPVADNTYVFVDFSPGDGVDDQVLQLDRGQTVKVFDPDRDNSGTTVQSIGAVAVTWGEDPETAATGSPFFDLGYSMPPLLDAWIDPVLDVDHSAAPGTLPTAGGTDLVVIDVRSFNYTVTGIDITELLPPGWVFVANSATITYPNGSVVSGAAANPVVSGELLTWDLSQTMTASQTMRIVFSAQTTGASLYGPNKFEATASGMFGLTQFEPNAPAFVTITPPPTVIKKLYLHSDDRNFTDITETDRDLDRIPPASPTQSVVISNDQTRTWTLAPALGGLLGIPSPIDVHLWGDPVTGSGLAPDVTVTLRSGSTVLGSDTIDDLNTAMVEHVFTITPLGAALPAGQTLSLDVSVKNGVGATFTVEFDSLARNSYLDVPTYSYINVDQIGTFNNTFANGGGTAQTSFDQGATQSIRAVISDPFGAFDITSVSLAISRDGTPVETVTPALVATVGDSKAYELVRNYTTVGTYTYTFTANEGTEGTVSVQRAGTFTVADDDRDNDGITNANEATLGTNPDNADSDLDGVQDGTEIGLTAPQGLSTDLGVFRPDQHAASTTLPLDSDTDNDLLLDGIEDTDDDGFFEPGNLETDPNAVDTDGDGINDGVEDADLDGVWDSGPETDANDTDTDNDLILDGVEDTDKDGLVDAGETNPRIADSDGDGIGDGIEDFDRDGTVDGGETNPRDDDFDDDGILDGNEDLDDDRVVDANETSPLNADTDADSIEDGVEIGLTTAQGTGTIGFLADVEPATTTNPRDDDHDDDGILDGNEDADRNGRSTDANETNNRAADTDGDLIEDGVEIGLVAPQGTGTTGFVADADPATTTSALDDDHDDDGLLDGSEDANQNGAIAGVETDNRDFDSDDDFLSDGLETGLAVPQGTGTNMLLFDADSQPGTTTNPLDDDDDEDGLLDGNEDVNQNGAVGAAETDPLVFDTDGDSLSDGLESGLLAPQGGDTDLLVFDADTHGASTTNPADDDTDNDGLIDGTEDLDGDGFRDLAETDPNAFDTDGDFLGDGLELGLTAGQGGDTAAPPFVADGDAGATTTNPILADTDGDLVDDGFEDLDRDGVDDASEWNPNDPDTDNDGLTDGAEDADHDGTRDASETDPLDGDTDNDLLMDGVEVNGANPTSPFDDDSDNDGLLDGNEDTSGDGGLNAGESNPNVFDTDGDALGDGKERGLTAPQGTGTAGVFSPDSDPGSTTLATDDDSDDDGVMDGNEDSDRDGNRDSNETDPNDLDSDNDLLQDGLELGLAVAQGDDTTAGVFTPDTNTATQTLPLDDDTDDDGLLDGTEDANQNGNRELTETRAQIFDTDADGLGDGQERGLTAPQGTGTDLGDFIADTDGATQTNPIDDDTDDDGRMDGTEDADEDGAVDASETNPGDFDTDDDLLGDGQEMGLTAGQGTGTVAPPFVADSHAASTTNPLDDDSDDDGILDGNEDADRDGFDDASETNPNANDTDVDGLTDGLEISLTAPQGGDTNPGFFDADTDTATQTDPLDADTDEDGLFDGVEDSNDDGDVSLGETDPLDDDTDDDGLLDGTEDANANGSVELAESDPLVLDTDADGLQDGVEAGLSAPEGADTDPLTFLADTHPASTTDPADDDTDDDGFLDGSEDADADGFKDASETDPNLFDTDGDLLSDGLEAGLGAPEGSDTNLATFDADGDAGATTTDPLDADSDDDLVIDGNEDRDRDGIDDPAEWNPNDADTDDDGLTDGDEDADHDGIRDVGETDPLDGDTDNDLIADGTEVEGANPTNPFDDDSDDDGILDGNEDANQDGIAGASETNPSSFDTDGDALSDGKEIGLIAGQGANTNPVIFQADTNPATTTSAIDDDTDNDGILDGNEDADRDGAVDASETDPNDLDTDDDFVRDGVEIGLTAPQGGDTTGFVADTNAATTTLPLDDDSDNDGILDGNEDADRDGAVDASETDPNDLDSDDDGVRDGVEIGLTAAQGGDTTGFVADANAATTTGPLDDDTDDDGLLDGTEDANGNGAVGTAESDPNALDSDADGLQDGLEAGLATPEGTDTSPGTFLADSDTGTTTNPADDDTDDDGRIDGNEDADEDGFVDATETDPNLRDSDADGVQDGTELGLTAPEGSDTGAGFIPDAHPASTTNPIDADTDGDLLTDGVEDVDDDGEFDVGPDTDPNDTDTDDDLLTDGFEDANHDGDVDAGETDPRIADADNDGIADGQEVAGPVVTDPNDDDTDDDGLLDGQEDTNDNGVLDAGETSPIALDSDGDQVTDGVELGLTAPQGNDTVLATFVADANPATTTNPRAADSDADGLGDGVEDANRNGAVGSLETDPGDADTDDDLILDGPEVGGVLATSALDDDSDDDGILDGNEDLDRDGAPDAGESDPTDDDTDGDGLLDGIELGLTVAQGGDTIGFLADGDGTSQTSLLDDDSDDDGLLDGSEDASADGVTDAQETAPDTADSDLDGVEDGIEVGLTAPEGVSTVGFLADADPATTTDPLDDDADDDGLLDGSEDGDANGAVAAAESNPLDPDSDADGILDGTESGLTTPQGTNTDGATFVADADPSSTTAANDDDSDDDGVLDGMEDSNRDGAMIASELDPLDPDTDDDGLTDGLEIGLTAPQGTGTNPALFQADANPSSTTDPRDDDMDDDGIMDGNEDGDHNGELVATETNPTLYDSDEDGLSDGLETGLTAPQGADTLSSAFVADSDPDSTTDPLNADTDGGGMPDGEEDIDMDGNRDSLERNPLDPRDDTDPVAAGSGCSCSLDANATGSPLASMILAMGALGCAFVLRRKAGVRGAGGPPMERAASATREQARAGVAR